MLDHEELSLKHSVHACSEWTTAQLRITRTVHTKTEEWQGELRERIQSSLPGSTVLLFNGNQVFDLTQDVKLQSPVEQAIPPTTKEAQLLELVRKVCVRPAIGLFSIVSQISPSGAADFEDLTVLDPADANQWLLVIVTAMGDDYVVFRRLFRGGS